MLKRLGIYLLAVGFLVGCGGDEEQPQPSFDSVGLESASAPPFSEVAVEQLPEDIGDGPVYAHYRIVGGDSPLDREENYATVVWRPEGADGEPGDRVMTVPFLLSVNGGEIEVVLTDGERESSPQTLTVEPIQVRAGAFEQTAAKLQTALEESASSVGVSLDEVDQMLRDGTIPEHFLPLAISYHIIADPQNDGALVNQQYDAETTELLDAIFTSIDLDEQLDAIVALQRQLEVPVSEPAPNAVTLDRVPYTIDGPQELSELMKAYKLAWDGARSLENFDETVGTYATVVALLARSKNGSAVLIKKIAQSVGALTSMSSEQITLIKALFPCCYTDFRTEFTGPAVSDLGDTVVVLEEDSNAPQVQLAHAYASVESEEIDLGKMALEKVVGKLQSGALSPSAKTELGEFAQEVNNELVVSPAISGALEDIQGKKFNFRWRNIDLHKGDRTARWLDIEVQREAFVHDLPNFGFFRATEFAAYAPVSSLVRINPNVDSYPVGTHTTIPFASTVLEMSHIEVVPQPEVSRGEPGETKDVTVRLENSNGLELDWEALSEGVTVEPDDGNPFAAKITLPDDPDLFPVVVRARSKTTVGLRSHAVFQTLKRPERAGYFHISINEGVFITPRSACITPGQTEGFHAEVYGPSDKTVDWSATGGEIDSDGVFQADGEGTFEITATSRADGSLSDTATITVGDCRCFAHVTVSGAVLADFGGHSSTAYGDLLGFGDDRAGGSSVALQNVTGFEVGALGTFEAQSAAVSLEDYNNVGMTLTNVRPEHKAFVTVTGWDGRYFTADFRMNSTFFGSVDPENPPQVLVSAKINGYASPDPMVDPDINNPCDNVR